MHQRLFTKGFIKNNHFTGMCCGTEAGSYLRLIDSCVTQLRAQGPSRTCNQSKEEKKDSRTSDIRACGRREVAGPGGVLELEARGFRCHPGGNSGANLKSISHRCHPILVASVWELTEETIDLPLG